MDNDELNLDQLDNVIAGAPSREALKSAINNQDLFRKEQIEELKKAKEELQQGQEQNNQVHKGR